MKLRYCRSWKVSITLAVVLLILASTAFAADAPLVGDGMMNGNTGTWTGGSASLFVVAQSGGTACSVKVLRTALNFDLTGVSQTIDSATLTLRVIGKSGTGNVALIPVNDTSFTSVNGATGAVTLDNTDFDLANPIGGNPGGLTAISAIPGAGEDWVVSTAALAAYLNSHKGGKVALGVIVFDCASGNPTVQFASSSSATPPRLSYTNPNAVTMSTFRAVDPAVNWPLIAGLGVLAAGVIAGLAVNRKRATAR